MLVPPFWVKQTMPCPISLAPLPGLSRQSPFWDDVKPEPGELGFVVRSTLKAQAYTWPAALPSGRLGGRLLFVASCITHPENRERP